MTRTVKVRRNGGSRPAINQAAVIPAQTLAFNLEMTRRMFDSSTMALQGWLQCLEQLQRATAATVKDLSSIATDTVDHAAHTTNWGELVEVYVGMTTARFMRAVQTYGALLGACRAARPT